MPTRTTQTLVRFSSPFLLLGFNEPQPAGEYLVEHDEEMIEVFSRLAWHRVGAFIHVLAIGNPGSTHQMVPIAPADLDALQRLDALARTPAEARRVEIGGR
jgi:hypothetical protein